MSWINLALKQASDPLPGVISGSGTSVSQKDASLSLLFLEDLFGVRWGVIWVFICMHFALLRVRGLSASSTEDTAQGVSHWRTVMLRVATCFL